MKKNLRIVSAAAHQTGKLTKDAVLYSYDQTTKKYTASNNTLPSGSNVTVYGSYTTTENGQKVTYVQIKGTFTDAFVRATDVKISTPVNAATDVQVKTTVNKKSELGGSLTDAEKGQIRKDLNVSDSIGFDVNNAFSILPDNKAEGSFYLTTNKKEAAFRDSSDAQALKKVFLDGKSVNNFDVDNNGNITVNGKKLEISVLRSYKAKDDASSENIVPNGKIPNTIYEADPNTAVNISAVAASEGWSGAVNGNIGYTDAKGAQHTALLQGSTNTTVYTVEKDGTLKEIKSGSDLKKNVLYVADFNDVTINLGNSEAGKSIKFVLPKNAYFGKPDKGYANVKTVKVDSTGVAHLDSVYARFYAYDPADLQEVHFYSQKTGNIVTSGSVDLHAVNGKLNIASLFASMNREYVASQLDNGKDSTYKNTLADTLIPQNDLRDQLKKQNIEVDPNGYFTAPASFTVNLNAKSRLNGATATLPVTVNVDNATETTRDVTIMHIATIYDKNGKATHEPALRAYNTVKVVSDPVQLKDEKGNNAGSFYKIAGKDEYIKVGNVDGTSRTLKKNSYVYKSTGKAYMKSKKHHRVLKADSTVKTYGKSFMIAGHQMYRIDKNQYVKKANF